MTLEELASRLYFTYSGNDPKVHCNRFPTWYELSEENRERWIMIAKTAKELGNKNG